MGHLLVEANKNIEIAPMMKGKKRVFNHIPGMEAIPVVIKGDDIKIRISASSLNYK